MLPWDVATIREHARPGQSPVFGNVHRFANGAIFFLVPPLADRPKIFGHSPVEGEKKREHSPATTPAPFAFAPFAFAPFAFAPFASLCTVCPLHQSFQFLLRR